MTAQVPPAAPPVTVARRRRPSHRWTVLGIVLLVVGSAATLVSLSPADGICRFVPCDPASPSVGFTAGTDGAVRIEFGPQAARRVDEILVVSGPDPDWTGSPVLWRAVRTGHVPDGWTGTVTLGRAPEGFVDTVPLTAPLTEATAVGVGNRCYGTLSAVPAGPLPTDAVVTQYEEVSSLDAFRAVAGDLSPCPDTTPRRPWPPGLAAAALGAGTVLVVLVRRRATGRGPSTP
ncbi:hypothetical protein [Cellulomonas sp. URHB0016]